MPKQPTNIYLPADLILEAKAMAKKQKTSLSAIVNKLLKEWVKREKRKLEQQAEGGAA
ncbi:DUF6364 family protein [Verrucomicrobium sp. BvORR106]|uniref:DUF6364 family protein n=1 Tax=Verrucomicrobium sp. BvORR106 TaxID=1403819 RepID=UPI0009E026A9|nr:DUF6364 family protein [Verrucomicrobium sp. BvORR106]